jgi:hypothetical protein
MATIRANGECLAEMKIYRSRTDNADGGVGSIDEMRIDTVTTYRAMSSGKMLRKISSVIDYGTGGNPTHAPGHWTVCGRVKPSLLTAGRRAVFAAMQAWADELRQKGLDVEMS